MQSIVVKNNEVPLRELGGGVSRKVLAHLPQMMVVEVRFDKGGVGAPHTHPHVQCTYVKSGVFDFTIEGEVRRVSEGDSIAFLPDVLHGTHCVEAGTLIDVFTPQRDDFLA